MNFSLFFFSSKDIGQTDKYRLLLEASRLADQLDLTAIWVPERHFDPFGGIFPSPSIAATAIAMHTNRIQIRAGSVVLPLHHPARIVEEWAMVDNLSGGRVGISFASGWHAQDFILQPENYAMRKEIMLSHLAIFQQLWRGDRVTFEKDGEGNQRSVQIYPKPLQATLPCWITATGHPDTFELAAKSNMRVLTHLLNHSIDDLTKKLARYYAACSKQLSPFVTLMLHTFISDSVAEVRKIVEKPLKNYLKTALILEQKRQLDDMSVSEDDLEDVLEFSFERYFSQSGLFGMPESCVERVLQLKSFGVNEIACLIDFGVDDSIVLANIKNISRLQQLINFEV